MRSLIQDLEFTCNGGESPPLDPIAPKPQPMRDVYIKTIDACPVRLDFCVPHRFRGKRVKVVIEAVE